MKPFKLAVLAIKDAFLQPFEFKGEPWAYFLNIGAFHFTCILVLAENVSMATKENKISLIVESAC